MSHLDRNTTRRGNERGAVLIMFAVFAPVAILFAVFAIDTGNWFVHKRHLQLQADAGALAAALSFQPCSNGGVEAAARQYSGVAGSPLYNEQVGGTSPSNIHELINSKTYYNQPSLIDPSAEEKPPCEANMVDVKLTETNLPWYWHPLSSVSNINAHARVEILQQSKASGLEPLAVAETAPVAAKAYFVNEDSKNAILAEAPLTKTEVNAQGQDVWSNVSAPVQVTINHPHIGVVIALSGKAGDTTCGHQFVECFGRKTETEKASVESAEPVLHVAGYPGTGSGTLEKPLAKEQTLTPITCTDGYFSVSGASCTFKISTLVNYGSAKTKGVTVTPEVKGIKGAALTPPKNAETEPWTGTATLQAGTGANAISLAYECKREVSESPCASSSSNPKATITDVHRIYAADAAHSGSIAGAWLGAGGGPPQDANSFPECSSCTQNLAVTVDVKGSLSDAAGFSDALRRLKFEGNNVIIECRPEENPSAAALRKHFAEGCPYHYKLNVADPTCTAVGEPYDCIAGGIPGKKNGAASGLDERIISPRPAGTEFYCPNEWQKANSSGGGVPALPNNDSRIVQTFIIPYGSLNEKGESNLPENAAPIQDFAAFYVMGFVGNESRCIAKKEGEEVAGKVLDPKTEASFEVVGHFIKYVNVIADEGGEKPKCKEDPLGECVAVLTR